jgi:hypothetical protein
METSDWLADFMDATPLARMYPATNLRSALPNCRQSTSAKLSDWAINSTAEANKALMYRRSISVFTQRSVMIVAGPVSWVKPMGR